MGLNHPSSTAQNVSSMHLVDEPAMKKMKIKTQVTEAMQVMLPVVML